MDTLLLCDFTQFFIAGLARTLRHRYHAVIGVDPRGLIPATVVGRLTNTPVLYWSLELYFLHDLKNWLQRLFKILEKRCSRYAQIIIIQDQYRAQSLMAENELDAAKVLLVPNSPMGAPNTYRYTYFRQKFDLQPEQRVIVQMGLISPDTLSLELATAAASWRAEYCLILHERYRRDRDDPYIQQIDQVGEGRVYLSLDPVALDDLDMIVGSSDVGVALYRAELGPNFAQMAGASGKLAFYLRSGLPVICLELPGMRDVLETYGCGLCVRDVGEIASALDRIFADYDSYSANAVKCYEERYEFSRHFEPVLARVEAMNGKRQAQRGDKSR